MSSLVHCCSSSRSDKDKNKNHFVTNYRVPSNVDLQAAEAAVIEGAIVLTMRYTYHADAKVAESEALMQRVFEFLAASGMLGTCVTNFAFERVPDGYTAIEVAPAPSTQSTPHVGTSGPTASRRPRAGPPNGHLLSRAAGASYSGVS